MWSFLLKVLRQTLSVVTQLVVMDLIEVSGTLSGSRSVREPSCARYIKKALRPSKPRLSFRLKPQLAGPLAVGGVPYLLSEAPQTSSLIAQIVV